MVGNTEHTHPLVIHSFSSEFITWKDFACLIEKEKA